MSSLWSLIETRATEYGGRAALGNGVGGAPLSYAALVERVNGLSQRLASLADSPISLCCDNGIDWVVADLACMAADCVLVPLPLFFTPGQLHHALDDAGVAHVLTDNPDMFAALGFQAQPMPTGLSRLTLMTRRPPRQARLPQGTRKITYTSGSTGTPKGVCLGMAQMERVVGAIDSALAGETISTHLCVLPLSTLLENVAGVYVPLLRGATVEVPGLARLGLSGSSSLETATFLAAITSNAPGSLILVPQLLQVLVSAAVAGWPVPRSLRFIAVGGSKVSESQLARAQQLGLPVYEGYGLSECGSVVSLNTPARRKIGSVGQPLGHVQVAVDEGEIVIRGNAFLGYSGDNADSLPEVFRTGDLGYLDEEGFLHISGRRKNLLITSFGRNISPEWIEAELMTLPGVLQAFLIGDARPYCAALLVTQSDGDDAAIEQGLAVLNRRLPDYTRIRHWRRPLAPFSVANQTLTTNGRLRREAIRDRHRAEIESLYPPDADASLTDSAPTANQRVLEC